MNYWMSKNIRELSEAETDDTLSALDLIIVRALLHDYKYAVLKNTNSMLDRVWGTPVSQVNINKTVSNDKPVQVELVGVEAGNEKSLQALKALKLAAEDESGESES